MEWQPIETAPKDEWILLYEPGDYAHVGEIGMRSYNDTFWICAFDNPTHWMPLPKPPKAGEQ